jgi:hypothetical protein
VQHVPRKAVIESVRLVGAHPCAPTVSGQAARTLTARILFPSKQSAAPYPSAAS